MLLLRPNLRITIWFPSFICDALPTPRSRTLVVERGSEPRLGPIKRAAVVPNFYAIDGEDGETIQELEKAFGLIETAGARIMRSMLDGHFPPRDADRLEFAGYMALQSVRGHAFRQAWEEMLAEERASMGRNFTAGVMVNNMPRLANAYLRMRWRMCRFAEPCLFTGDQPVSYWREGPTGRFFTGIAPLSAQEVRFPLSPDHALVLTWKGCLDEDRVYEHSVSVARVLNHWTARWCDTELYCRPDLAHMLPTDPVERLAPSLDPNDVDAVMRELTRYPNWQQADEVAQGLDWGGPAAVHGLQSD